LRFDAVKLFGLSHLVFRDVTVENLEIEEEFIILECIDWLVIEISYFGLLKMWQDIITVN
jgi:hypothetical protein